MCDSLYTQGTGLTNEYLDQYIYYNDSTNLLQFHVSIFGCNAKFNNEYIFSNLIGNDASFCNLFSSNTIGINESLCNLFSLEIYLV